jgi:hypothetical protein
LRALVRRSRSARGATLPEYALLLVAVMLVAAGAYYGLGRKVDGSARTVASVLAGGEGGGNGGGVGGNPGGAAASVAGGSERGFFGNFWRGLTLGDFAGEGGGWGQVAGQVVGGFIPIYGQIADIRDAAAAVRDISQGREGGWRNLAMAGVGFIPGVGDAAKGIVRGADGVVRAGVRNADEVAAALPRVADAVPDSRGIVAGALRRGDDGAERVMVHGMENTWENGRHLEDVAGNTPVYRVQPDNLPMTPHASPYFDPIQYGLPPGKYEALYVSPSKEGLEGLRRQQGYFDEAPNMAMHQSTLGDLVKNSGGDTIVFRDTKLEWSTGIPGYVIVRKLP